MITTLLILAALVLGQSTGTAPSGGGSTPAADVIEEKLGPSY